MFDDNHYPEIEISFLHKILLNSPKCIDHFKTGKTTSYILEGDSFIGKRTLTLRDNRSGLVPFEKASSIAIRSKMLAELLKYLEEQKDFKDGGYKVPTENK